MTEKVVLGIHSEIDPNAQGSLDQFVNGHAWISVTRNGDTRYYGLWPDSHPNVPDNGPATDIREGMEALSRPNASRYYELTPQQTEQLDEALAENVKWMYINTCASWATSTVNRVTGQTLDAGELMLTDTPRELIESIQKAERLHPTSPSHPQPPSDPKQHGSSASSLSGASATLHQQATEGVHKLDAGLGRQPDESSERMAASLAHLARERGLERIDHVVLGTSTSHSPDSQNVFIVQGALNDPAHRRAHMAVTDALSVPVEDSLRQLQQADHRATATQALTEPAQIQTQEEAQLRHLA